MKVRLFFEGAGAAILMLIAVMWEFLLPDHLVLYHNPRPLSTVVGALALDLFLASILAAAAFALLDHFDSRQTSIVWAAVVALVIVRIFGVIHFLLDYYNVESLAAWNRRSAIEVAVFIAAFLLWWRFPATFQKCARATRIGLALVGCCVLWMLPQLSVLALHTPRQNASAFVRPGFPDDPPPSDRLVWILFDELSYDQVFDHRQPGISLPHFDQLKNESVVFSDVQPAGFFTDIIVPSLFLGRRLDSVRSSMQGDLYVYPTQTRHWEAFDQNATLFHDARQWGWSTGIAGWFNPYCRILPNVLDWCYWESINPFAHGLSDQKTTLANARDLFADLTFSRLAGPSQSLQFASEIHAQEYSDVLPAATSLLRDEAVRFVFIHLPVPHPPGIYNRKTHVLGVRGTYFDNLVLADQALGGLLDTLAKTASASRTTIIVSSDHSWRVGMWRMNTTAWTREEEQATGGKFDPRPVLLIHFPEETGGETLSTPFAEIKTRDLIDAMLQAKLRSQASLDQWLNSK